MDLDLLKLSFNEATLVDIDEILKLKSRDADSVFYKHLYCHTLVKRYGLKLEYVASQLVPHSRNTSGKVCHSVVIHAIKNIEKQLLPESENYSKITRILKRLDYLDRKNLTLEKMIDSAKYKNKLIYLACPYSHPDSGIRLARFKKITDISARLVANGVVAFSPITYGHTLLDYTEMPTDWKFWQNFCIGFLKKSDELWVYKFEGWDKSEGLLAEVEYAIKNRITVKYIEDESSSL